MRRTIIIIIISSIINTSFGQQKNASQKDINLVIKTFMRCIVEKDSVTFYGLFHSNPVAWVGVYKDRTQQKRLEKDSTAEDSFTDNYKDFYRSLSNPQKRYEEQFDNIRIIEDGSIASATFDYSFWFEGKMFNWGSEHWGLIKTNGKWKITSVIFSMELTKYFEKPLFRKGKNLQNSISNKGFKVKKY